MTPRHCRSEFIRDLRPVPATVPEPETPTTEESPETAPSPAPRPWLRSLGSLLLALLFVGALLTQVKGRDLQQVVRDLHPGWALISLLTYGVMPLCRGWRMAVLLGGRASSRRLMAIAAVQNYLIFILPLRAGDVSFIVLLTREPNISAALATKTMVAVRLLDLSFILAAFLVVLALPGVCPPQAHALGLPVALILLVLIGLWLWPDVVGRWLWRLLGPLVQWLEQRRLPGAGKVRGYLQGAMSIENVKAYRATLPPTLLATLVLIGLIIVRQWSALNAVGANLALPSGVYLASTMTVLSALPIHGLAGFGPGDAAGAGLLMTVLDPAHPTGFAWSSAIAVQLGSHVLVVVTTTIVGLLGGLILHRMGTGKKGKR